VIRCCAARFPDIQMGTDRSPKVTNTRACRGFACFIPLSRIPVSIHYASDVEYSSREPAPRVADGELTSGQVDHRHHCVTRGKPSVNGSAQERADQHEHGAEREDGAEDTRRSGFAKYWEQDRHSDGRTRENA
jgi:hypothetical protein